MLFCSTIKILSGSFGLQPYEPVSQAMHEFTDARDEDDTSTRSGWWNITPYSPRVRPVKRNDVLVPGDIPVIQSDRGGQRHLSRSGTAGDVRPVDLKRRKLGVRELGDAAGANGRQYPG